MKVSMMIRMDSMDGEEFKKSFEVLNSGLNLVDGNGDLWYLVDRDGVHNVYVRDLRSFEDVSDKKETN